MEGSGEGRKWRGVFEHLSILSLPLRQEKNGKDLSLTSKGEAQEGWGVNAFV